MRRNKGISDTVYSNNANIKKAYDMAKAIPLLPSAYFERGIDVVAETARGSNGTADPRFTQFVNYLRSYWLPSTHQPQDNNILSTTFKSPIIHF